MSKLTKFITKPRRFWIDSWMFKRLHPQNGNVENLFIISTTSQRIYAESLIKHYNLKNNYCVILYTKKNTVVPKQIKEGLTNELWLGQELFLLPNEPNALNAKKWRKIKRNYHQLINRLMPKNLYVQSFETHYVFVSNFAMKCNIKLHLIEEGTSTYKNPKEFELINFVPVKTKIIFALLGVLEGLRWHYKYDHIYATYPRYLKKVFKAKKWHRFSRLDKLETNPETLALIEKYQITSNDMIFVNQRYNVHHKAYFGVLAKILKIMANYYECRVFIKMHPRDTIKARDYFKKCIAKYPQLIMIEDNAFLVENTIKETQVKAVIGLSSTSLVYANYVSPNTQAISITLWLLHHIPYAENKSGVDLIQKHQRVISIFKHIKVLPNHQKKHFPKLNHTQ